MRETWYYCLDMAPKKRTEIKSWKNKACSEESTEAVSENFQLVAAAQHMMLLWHWLNPSPDVFQNKTTYISSVIPQPCNLRICVWQHSQLCFQKEDQILGMSELVRVKQTCSHRDSEMSNQSQQEVELWDLGKRRPTSNVSSALYSS